MSSITSPRINKIVPSNPNNKHHLPSQTPMPIRGSTIGPVSKHIVRESDTPQNAPVNWPIRPITKKPTLPTTTEGEPYHHNNNNCGGGGVPINAANVIVGMGRGVIQHPHAVTPGNTLNINSLEKITNRIANNLGGFQDDHEIHGNKIAPSYERNFNAGLGELTRRLSSPSVLKSPSPMISPSSPSSAISKTGSKGLDQSKTNEWPHSFSDLDDNTDSIKSRETGHTTSSPPRQ